MELMWKERVVARFKVLRQVYLAELMETIKTLSKHPVFGRQGCIWHYKCERGILASTPSHSVGACSSDCIKKKQLEMKILRRSNTEDNINMHLNNSKIQFYSCLISRHPMAEIKEYFLLARRFMFCPQNY